MAESYDLPIIAKYRMNVLFKFALPLDTGNLRHNAAKMILLKPGVKYRIDEAEADYTRVVFEYYVYRKGQNFMFNAAQDIYDFLNIYLHGGRPEYGKNYIIAKRNVLYSAQGSFERDERNIMHGTGTKVNDKEGTYNNVTIANYVFK